MVGHLLDQLGGPFTLRVRKMNALCTLRPRSDHALSTLRPHSFQVLSTLWKINRNKMKESFAHIFIDTKGRGSCLSLHRYKPKTSRSSWLKFYSGLFRLLCIVDRKMKTIGAFLLFCLLSKHSLTSYKTNSQNCWCLTNIPLYTIFSAAYGTLERNSLLHILFFVFYSF